MIQDLQTKSFSLSEATTEKIDRLIPRYPERRSAMLPILHLILEEHGYIPDPAIEWVASRLELEPIAVYEVVTFYPMLRRTPTGKHHVKVCRTLSCALAGSATVCKKFLEAFDCQLDEVSPSGEVTVEYVECIASCGTAPVVQIGEVLHENVTPEKTEELITSIRNSNT
ncbi:MAG: NADH-quinone oxidoreductase subunit NuoE [Puniceicoccaceae bacterium]